MSTRDVDNTLRNIPLNDRIGALILNLCEQRVDAIDAIRGLIVAAGIIGKNLPSQNDRRRCAMKVREVAVELESEHVPLIED
jgi:hypothetical protein